MTGVITLNNDRLRDMDRSASRLPNDYCSATTPSAQLPFVNPPATRVDSHCSQVLASKKSDT